MEVDFWGAVAVGVGAGERDYGVGFGVEALFDALAAAVKYAPDQAAFRFILGGGLHGLLAHLLGAVFAVVGKCGLDYAVIILEHVEDNFAGLLHAVAVGDAYRPVNAAVILAAPVVY